MADKSLCTECGEQPRDGDGYPKWCKPCRKAYDQKYRKLKAEMSETKGFAAGVAAFRAHIVGKFLEIPSSARIDAQAAAAWVKTEQFGVPQD